MRKSVLAALALLVAGCTLDDIVKQLPYLATMTRQPSVAPYTMNRPPVPGTVPVTGTEPALRISANRDTLALIDRLVNPRSRTAESLERGRWLYATYCAVCHGPAGAGDGQMAVPNGPFPPMPVTSARARTFTDGYIFTLVRFGRGVMPRYGDKVRGNDRWDLVNYVRELQAAGEGPR